MAARADRSRLLLILPVAVMLLAWILVIPPSGGPDEPDHLVRGAGLVRGQVRGEPVRGAVGREFRVPAATAHPDPACYAEQPTIPATCTAGYEVGTGTRDALSRAGTYPLWGHLVIGLPSLIPAGTASTYLARLFVAAVAGALSVLGLAALRRRGPLALGAGLVALTPMAWFTMSIANPSAFAVAGGFALWIGLTGLSGTGSPSATVGRSWRDPQFWLLAGGAAALALTRRDGLIWAGAILAVDLWRADATLAAWWAALGRRVQIAFGVIGVLGVIGAIWPGGGIYALAVLGPALVPAAAIARSLAWPRRWDRAVAGTWIAAGVAVVAAVFYAAMNASERVLAFRVVTETGRHLIEAIGVLGWLDAPVPAVGLILTLLALGALIGRNTDLTAARTALVVAVVAVGLSWVMEFASGNDSGRYWQGRYYLPLLVGIPLLLAVAPGANRTMDAVLGRALGAAGLLSAQIAMVAMVRRFAVGTEGPLAPWSWGSYGQPLPVLAVLVVHLLAAAVLWWGLLRRTPVEGRSRA